MALDLRGLWNLRDGRVYVLFCGVLLLVLGGIGSLPVGKLVLPIEHPLEIVLFGFGGALAALSGFAIVRWPAQGEPDGSRGEITFDLKEVLGENAKDLKIKYRDLTTVEALLDKIYYSIRSKVPAGSYGEQWILRKEENEEPLRILSTVWAQLFDEREDFRSPREVGIEPGMKFKVRWYKQPFLWINPNPKAGRRALIMELRYHDLDTIDGLLNKIGEQILPTQSSPTYGDKWVLRDAASGETLDIGPGWAKRNGRARDDRSLAEAGIKGGVRLRVVFITLHSDPIDTAPEGSATPDRIRGASPPKA